LLNEPSRAVVAAAFTGRQRARRRWRNSSTTAVTTSATTSASSAVHYAQTPDACSLRARLSRNVPQLGLLLVFLFAAELGGDFGAHFELFARFSLGNVQGLGQGREVVVDGLLLWGRGTRAKEKRKPER
jgi:hypothetical protein